MSGGFLDPLAQSSSVDELVQGAANGHQLVDRVNRRPGDIRNHGTILAGQTVEKRGLADVRLADDGDTTRTTGRLVTGRALW